MSFFRTGISVIEKVAFFFALEWGFHRADCVEDAAALFENGHAAGFDDFIDGFDCSAHFGGERMSLLEAFAIEHAVGEGDPVAERRKIMVLQVPVRLAVPIAIEIMTLPYADVPEGKLVTKRRRPREANVGFPNQLSLIRALHSRHAHAVTGEGRQCVNIPPTDIPEGA